MREGDEKQTTVATQPDVWNIRGVALTVIAVVAVIVFIDWAQALLLPLVASILISYALDPLVLFLERYWIPRPLGAAIILLLLITGIALASIPLKQEAVAMLEKVPAVLNQFERTQAIQADGRESFMDKAQEAANKIRETTQENSSEAQTEHESEATAVRIVDEPFNLEQYLMEGSSAALVLVTQWFSVLLLVYFLLAVGSLYKRKVVRIAGPSFHRMRKAVRLLDEFHRQVRRFIFVMLVGAVFVGVLTWLAFELMSVEQAALWGVVAGVASAVPYLGPFLVLIGTAVASFLQFGTLNMAALVGFVSLAITSVQGYFLTPWLASKVSSVNAVVIFIGLLFWGWLWGPVGVILATPILMIIKTFCDHVESLRPFGELLGK